MRIAVVGAGALGSLFAARLASVASVIMLSRWAEAIAEIKAQGLRLVDAEGERAHLVPISSDSSAAAPADLALVLVKSYDTAHAAEWAATALAPTGLALTLQNGLGNAEILAAMVGLHRTVQGVTSEGATLLGPGRVRHAGSGVTSVGTKPDLTARLEEIAALFRQAGFATDLSDRVDSLVWGKLVISAGINPLTALLDVPNSALVEDDAARAALRLAVDEAAAIAGKVGIPLPYPDAGTRAEEVCRATAANLSSMLQDVRRGSRTEIDAINGALVSAAAAAGLAAPVNRLLWHLVRAREGRLRA
ncbi:MAG: 2-dehydropantoate 2-reductase [Anaerolineae bacterium]|nr:2-dehydropantoate 2-reductase [Anaerolineae bacterium]